MVFVAASVHYFLTARSRPEPPEARSVAGVKASFENLFRSLSAATSYGALLGLAIGGIGSRLAMRLLFLTSADEVRGLESDDGFIIGKFDLADTLNLVLFGTLVGLMGGLVYLLIRRWLPGPRIPRSAVAGAGAGTVVGSAIVHADGVDFTVLGPLWLAIGLFVLIPASFGWLISVLVDSADRTESWFRRKRLGVALIPLVLLLFPPVSIALAIPLGLTLLCRWVATRDPRALPLWESRQFLWAGRLAGLAIGALGTLALINDIRALV